MLRDKHVTHARTHTPTHTHPPTHTHTHTPFQESTEPRFPAAPASGPAWTGAATSPLPLRQGQLAAPPSPARRRPKTSSAPSCSRARPGTRTSRGRSPQGRREGENEEMGQTEKVFTTLLLSIGLGGGGGGRGEKSSRSPTVAQSPQTERARRRWCAHRASLWYVRRRHRCGCLCSARTPGRSTLSGTTTCTSNVFVLAQELVLCYALPYRTQTSYKYRCTHVTHHYSAATAAHRDGSRGGEGCWRPAATATPHATGSPSDAHVAGLCLLQGGTSLLSVRFQRRNVFGVANFMRIKIRGGIGIGMRRDGMREDRKAWATVRALASSAPHAFETLSESKPCQLVQRNLRPVGLKQALGRTAALSTNGRLLWPWNAVVAKHACVTQTSTQTTKALIVTQTRALIHFFTTILS